MNALSDNPESKDALILEAFRQLGDETVISHQVIANIADSRVDNVKRTLERLRDKAVIQLTPLEEVNHKGQKVESYYLNKRDSLIAIAQIKPEVTAALVDRWEELEKQNAPKALSFEEQVVATLSIARERVKALENKVEEDAPKVQFFETVTAGDNVCKMAVACQVADLPFGAVTLYRKLRASGHLISGAGRHNHPKQRYIDMGLFTLEEGSYKNDKTQEVNVYYTTYVTQKGIDWLIKKFKTEEEAA